jgi:hypothetical protein
MNISKRQLKKIIKEEIALAKKRNLGYGEGEGLHTKSQLHKVAQYATELHHMIEDHDDLPEWVQSKIATISSDIGKVKHYLEYKILRMEQGE